MNARRSSKQTRNFRSRSERGFTLLELSVSISVIFIITAVAIFNHKMFSDVIELANVTEEVALKVREAQLKGLAVQEYSGSGSFQEGRGVYFNLNDPTQYIYFGDESNGGTPDGEYDDTTEHISTEMLKNGFTFIRFEDVDGAVILKDEFAVTFRRPRPEARLWFEGGAERGAVRIIIESPKERQAYVEINQTGQITTGRENN
ncbi:MAG: prepilin-type N-terminal cleavage/methylation domain-containing protein [Candidatus Paceibacterota bacterium]